MPHLPSQTNSLAAPTQEVRRLADEGESARRGAEEAREALEKRLEQALGDASELRATVASKERELSDKSAELARVEGALDEAKKTSADLLEDLRVLRVSCRSSLPHNQVTWTCLNFPASVPDKWGLSPGGCPVVPLNDQLISPSMQSKVQALETDLGQAEAAREALTAELASERSDRTSERKSAESAALAWEDERRSLTQRLEESREAARAERMRLEEQIAELRSQRAAEAEEAERRTRELSSQVSSGLSKLSSVEASAGAPSSLPRPDNARPFLLIIPDYQPPRIMFPPIVFRDGHHPYLPQAQLADEQRRAKSLQMDVDALRTESAVLQERLEKARAECDAAVTRADVAEVQLREFQGRLQITEVRSQPHAMCQPSSLAHSHAFRPRSRDNRPPSTPTPKGEAFGCVPAERAEAYDWPGRGPGGGARGAPEGDPRGEGGVRRRAVFLVGCGGAGLGG